MSTNHEGNGLFGFALFLVFLTLKLTDVIDWSWLWVTAPLWIPFAFVAAVLLCFVVVAALTGSRVKITRD